MFYQKTNNYILKLRSQTNILWWKRVSHENYPNLAINGLGTCGKFPILVKTPLEHVFTYFSFKLWILINFTVFHKKFFLIRTVLFINNLIFINSQMLKLQELLLHFFGHHPKHRKLFKMILKLRGSSLDINKSTNYIK